MVRSKDLEDLVNKCYKQGYDATSDNINPYSRQGQILKFHAFQAGFYDSKKHFPDE